MIDPKIAVLARFARQQIARRLQFVERVEANKPDVQAERESIEQDGAALSAIEQEP